MVQPLRRRLLCKPIESEEAFGRIILLPDRLALITEQQAEVVAVAADVHDARLQPGAWILHGLHARVAGPDEKTFWLAEDDVQAILEVA